MVISVEHLTKSYDLGVVGTGTLSRDLNRWWARLRKQPDPYTRIGQKDAFDRNGESILALDDVSFTVQQGEALGIIGRNGAGKSTLLKILSRVTAPTSGVVKVKGRIGSLLEVGTGFHPELTGRENVYLNGAILGMKKVEVTHKFDEIVDFSGVEKFIDTPVKRYSSGMYVRLAFAVAAHLDPEILIVDEVLAVGDAEFQKKCLGKMGDVAGEGRTVLFVSHNLSMIRQLCKNAILLINGRLNSQNRSDIIVSSYLKINEIQVDDSESIKIVLSALPIDPVFRILDVSITQEGFNVNHVGNGKSVDINIKYTVYKDTPALRVFFDLLDTNDEILFRSFHDSTVSTMPTVKAGTYISTATIPADWLSPRMYYLRILAAIHNTRMLVPSTIRIPLFVENTSNLNRAYSGDPIRGLVSPNIFWNTITIDYSSRQL